MQLRPLLAIAGPTGSGKSDLAIELAETFGGEIVSCDSLQVYRYFNIGTAKPTEADRHGIPHHLIDIVDPEQSFTAGDYARAARPLLRDISARARLPVVAGGTGFYLRALLEGLFEGPSRDEGLRNELIRRESRRRGFLHRLLRRLDAGAASRIHANDSNKLARAVEVCLVEGRPLSQLFAERQREPLSGFSVLKLVLWPDRDELYRRLDARSEAMFDAGLVEEARDILAAGHAASAKPFESLGYAQALRVLRGELSREDALEEMRRETRRYAKRQLTWFRRERGSQCLAGFGDDPAIREKALMAARAWLAALEHS